ncbi:LysR family transcriptional regulator [Roseivivax halodurans JCM 10272]|uniref:LysR family transcriptional regulator n=1 Tax=Roseivivax halodurans JCM 10272 TaxID=1449350 RepID=X7EIG7_9RHOB|nr:LysR family transcriptional regulator [Roseivivax halodurans]ETX14918.1 LysR family transcriptional regulator [Roseivivax halodurans JCM 10272]
MAYVANVRTFVRVYELGSMSAAARDQRCSPAVASSRIAELERHLGARLFNRTTRALTPTEAGQLFYDGAREILSSIETAEGRVMAAADAPRGTVFVAAPLGLGRRVIAPMIPAFREAFPDIAVRLRLTDRAVDMSAEGLDLALHLGPLVDSTLKFRKIADCPRSLVAAPEYIARRGHPRDGAALVEDGHDCLNLRFPGATEFRWTLATPEGHRSFAVSGPLESDDGDVLTDWALAGLGIALKPEFEVAEHLASGRLVRVCEATPPLPVPLACLSPTRTSEDPKLRVFAERVEAACRAALA